MLTTLMVAMAGCEEPHPAVAGGDPDRQVGSALRIAVRLGEVD